MTHPDTPTFTCIGCGRITPDDDNGCYACDLCEGCTPDNVDCRDMRAETRTALRHKYLKENQ
jgi:hypothetical protein